MKLHRFIGEYNLSKKEVEITDSKIINQIKAVLRLKKGDKIILSDGKGQSGEIILDIVSTNKITGTISKINLPADAESFGEARKVDLYLSILKKENFELAVQKAVEAGVSNITPIITERTIKTGLNVLRLEKIILEASEQCGRNIVPALSPILDFKNALIDGAKNEEKIIFHLNGEKFHPSTSSGQISIFVDPEGGFTSKEIILAKENGYTIVSLGPLTLRGETAAIIATYRAVQGI